MKNTFTFRQIYEAVQASAQLSMIQAPQKTAYRTAKLVKQLRSIAKDIDKKRLDLFKEWGVESTPGKNDWKVPDDKMPAFSKAMEFIMDETLSIDYLPIPCNHFERLSAEIIIGMGEFMVESEVIDTDVKRIL